MPNERENLLTMRQYEIAGNDLRAYYDDAGRLVFVLDYTVAADKPNVLLVIDAPDGRKWDDVLANDWNVDLETVRPKKDNKYQKLDVEYHALSAYDGLIRAYDDGADIASALRMLVNFRHVAVQRNARERLDAANAAADTARETIARTNDSVAELQVRLRELRAKLSQQKKSIGREPTKQSASKILRSESQIDATNEKIRRARRRLANAQRRLLVAEEDARLAREILDSAPGEKSGAVTTTIPADTVASENAMAIVPVHENENVPVPVADAPLPLVQPEQNTEIVIKQSTNEPKAKEMADEEVKPLFDKDPEILDEEIAFKPIEFDTPSSTAVPNTPAPSAPSPIPEYTSAPQTGSPMSFVPPVSLHDEDANNNYAPVSNIPPAPSAPVLDSLTPTQQATPMATPESRPEPVAPVAPVAPVSGGGRPVSPISGNVAPVGGDTTRQKPSKVYYLMLIVLIVLAIFTLWLYQKRNGDSVPELETTAPVQTVEKTTDVVEDSPFIETEPVTVAEETPAEVEPEPVAVAPEPEPEPEPVAVVPEPAPEPEPVVQEPEPEPVVVEPEPQKVISEEEIIASKPAYNVSQQEKMFVASPSYDTEITTTATTYQNTSDDDAATPGGVTCDDGTEPDKYGCCAGEVYSDLGGGQTGCCSETTGECFAPLK